VAFVTKAANLTAKGFLVASKPKKIHEHLKTPDLRIVLPRSKRLRAMKRRI